MSQSAKNTRLNSFRQTLKNNLVMSNENYPNRQNFNRSNSQQQESQIFPNSPKINYFGKNFFEKYSLIDKVVGQGNQAVLKQCIHKETQKKYAVKISRTCEEEYIKDLKQTFKNHFTLNHPHIPKVLELFIDEENNTQYYVLEYIQLPNLKQVLKSRGRLEENEAKKIMFNLVKILKYIHSQGICHRDIKPDNILVDIKTWEVKLIDFGVSKNYIKKQNNNEEKISMFDSCGCVNYRAPEIFKGLGYDESVDLWSLGVTSFYMLCGKHPFNSLYVQDNIKKIKNCQWEFDISLWNNISEECKDFISKLLAKDYLQRMCSTQCLLHSWLKIKKQEKLQQNDINSTLSSENNIILDNQHLQMISDLSTPKFVRINHKINSVIVNNSNQFQAKIRVENKKTTIIINSPSENKIFLKQNWALGPNMYQNNKRIISFSQQIAQFQNL